MPVITISGLFGSGANEVGAEVARRLNLDYVDRLLLAEAARKLGATVAEVAEQAERPVGFGDRVSSFVHTVLERSALAGSGADPYFGGGMDMLLVREYRDIPEVKIGEGGSDQHLLEVLTAVTRELAQSGRALIIGRGANMVLRDWPGALHVGAIAERPTRVQRVMERERLGTTEEGERYIDENDKGRTAFYQRFFGTNPQDPRGYNLMVNTDRMSIDQASDLVVAAQEIIGHAG